MVCQKHARDCPETIAYKRIRLSEQNIDVFNTVDSSGSTATESKNNHGGTLPAFGSPGGRTAEGENITCRSNVSFGSTLAPNQDNLLLDDSSTICSLSIVSPQNDFSTRGSSITSDLPSYIPNAQLADATLLKDRENHEREPVTDQVCFGMVSRQS